MGLNCDPTEYSAYDFLQAVGESAVISIQRLNTKTGMFETASWQEGVVVGVDFSMGEGEGYIVFMRQDSIWSPP